MNAIQLACLYTWAPPPLSISIILAKVPAIGIEIGILECDKIEVIEVTFARCEIRCHRRHLGVARGTGRVALLDA